MLRRLKDIFFCNGATLIFKAYKQKFIQLHQLISSFTESKKDTQRTQHTEHFLKQLEVAQTSKIKFIKLLLTSFWKQWLYILFFSIITVVFVGIEPYLSTKILILVKQQKQNNLSIVEVILILFFSKGVKSLIAIHLYYKQYQIGVNLYVNLSLAIHKESSRLQRNNKFDSAVKGKTLTLLQEDCNKLTTFPYFLSQLPLILAQIIYGLCYLSFKLPKCNFSLGYYILIVYFLVSLALGFLVTSFTENMLRRKDQRLGLSIVGIENCDIQGEPILAARKSELSSLKNILNVEIIIRTSAIFFSALFLTVTLIWNYESLDIETLYLVILLYSQINYPISQLPFLIQNFNQLLVNLDRVLHFLQNRETSIRGPRVSPIKQTFVAQLKEYKKVGVISWKSISFYLSRGSIPLFCLFFITKIIVEACNITSSFINRSLSKHTSHSIIDFFNPFLPVVPFAVSLYLIFRFSLNTSRKVYPQIQVENNKQSKSVMLNLLSNDLRVIDRVICINIFDCLSGGLSIFKNIGLSLYTISLSNKNYSLLMIPVILLSLFVLSFINRGFMWIRRECTRLEGISKTPFLEQFYSSIECIDSKQNNSQIQTETYNKLNSLLNQTAKIELVGVYYESWYQLVLVLFSIILISFITTVASLVVDDSSMLGLIFSQVLILDSIFREFFISSLIFQRNAISLQRFYNIIRQQPNETQDIHIATDSKESLLTQQIDLY